MTGLLTTFCGVAATNYAVAGAITGLAIFRVAPAFTSVSSCITVLTLVRVAATSVAANFVDIAFIPGASISATLLSYRIITRAITAGFIRPPAANLAGAIHTFIARARDAAIPMATGLAIRTAVILGPGGAIAATVRRPRMAAFIATAGIARRTAVPVGAAVHTRIRTAIPVATGAARAPGRAGAMAGTALQAFAAVARWAADIMVAITPIPTRWTGITRRRPTSHRINCKSYLSRNA